MSTLDLEILQFSPVPGDPEANITRIAGHARDSTADLVVTPELSLTGYDIGDAAAELAREIVVGEPLPGAAPLADVGPAVVVGLPETARDGVIFNSLAILDRGVVRFRHRKLYLPTYGMFDEARFFGRGDDVEPFTLGDWRIGFLVCEDFWHPGLSYVLAATGIDLLVVIAAAPGRGGPADEDASRFANMATWERIARTTAQQYAIWIALANRCGVEGGATFGGNSLIVAPDGAVAARSDGFEESTVRATLSGEAILRARRPYSHARDEDLRLMRSLLERHGA